MTEPGSQGRDAANAAYVRGLCKQCHTNPYQPGSIMCAADCLSAPANRLRHGHLNVVKG